MVSKTPHIVAKDAVIRKLHDFRDRLGITKEHLTILRKHRETFLSSRTEFREKFYDFFFAIPETKAILEHMANLETLFPSWEQWFESLFRHDLDDDYLMFIWNTGKRHVELNVDHRFTDLGFAMIRKFFSERVWSNLPPDEVREVSAAIEKMLELNQYVMNAAYIDTTIHCDIEVIKGIQDKLRNPVTVIGGSIMRLMKDATRTDSEKLMLDSLIDENSKLEQIVTDVRKFMEVFEAEPMLDDVPVKDAIESVLGKLTGLVDEKGITVEFDFDDRLPGVTADREHLEHILYSLIENSLEAADPADPRVRISTAPERPGSRNMLIEIFNPGRVPTVREVEKFFSPFYSTKTRGTGFGLPLARMAARKNYGKVVIAPVPEKGIAARVILPLPD